jgi:hypothetical protein
MPSAVRLIQLRTHLGAWIGPEKSPSRGLPRELMQAPFRRGKISTQLASYSRALAALMRAIKRPINVKHSRSVTN